MEQNRLFKWVWRFNSLLIAVAGILAIAVTLYLLYEIRQTAIRERNTFNTVNVEQTSTVRENWQLSYIAEVKGTPMLLVSLNSDQSYEQSYYSKSATASRNYLFINTQSNSSKWLLPHNNYLFLYKELISDIVQKEKSSTVQAILFTLIKSDTDGDLRLTDNDVKTIALSRPNGTDYHEVLTGIDRLVGKRLISTNTLLLIYQRNNMHYSAYINLTDFKLDNETALPLVNG